MGKPTSTVPTGSDDLEVFYWEEPDFRTIEVVEDVHPTHSTILGPDGRPIQYANPKLGFIGFRRLR